MVGKRKERQSYALSKRENTEKKLEHAKSIADIVVQKQKEDFITKEQKVEEKMKLFEKIREKDRIDMQKRALLKSLKIKKVMDQNS